jgi:hypothetical protein
MSGSCIATFCKISLAFALLGAVAERADAQRSRDVHLTVSALVIASATRIEHAEATAIGSQVTGPQEREVQLLVTAKSSGESILSIVPRMEGVTIDVLGADGEATRVGTGGVSVVRTMGGREISAPVRLRLRSGNPELLEQAARAPVTLMVDSTAR